MTPGNSPGSAAARATISSAWPGTPFRSTASPMRGPVRSWSARPARVRERRPIRRRSTILQAPNSRSCPAIRAATRSRWRCRRAKSKAIAAGRLAVSASERAPQWLTDGILKVLVQFTAGKPDLPNAPVATDLAKTKEGREAIQILSADSVLAWPPMAPPGLPADRVRELRTAFDAMMAAPALLADAKKANLDVDRVSGAEMQVLID